MSRIPPELARRQKSREPMNPIEFLSQSDHIDQIDALGTGEWTTLYAFETSEKGSLYTYSALLEPIAVESALSTSSHDLTPGRGRPGFTVSNDHGVEKVTYHRLTSEGVEPIVHVRDFYGIKPAQIELSEEFRHFHNLYHDRHNDDYIHISDGGEEIVAAEVRTKFVRIRTRFLRQYMAARQLHLAIYFDHLRDATVPSVDVKAALSSLDVKEKDRRYSFYAGARGGLRTEGDRSFSRLIGKRLIPPPPVADSNVWPYERPDREYIDFIIASDESGEPLFHSCDPEKLANYFGANEGAPHYLTPVWFNRKVLSKYYEDADKFDVEDGYIRCGSLWGIRVDNDLPDYVVVYLGDLGRDLSVAEQRHWRNFNVPPGNRMPSETNFRRSFLAEFTDASSPEHVFKRRYSNLSEAWQRQFGWPLFRSLHPDDAHVLKGLHIPFGNTVAEFELQVLYLTKLLVDYLNEIDLAGSIGGAQPNEKGIGKFERFLEAKSYPEKVRDVALLRRLQDLRSAIAAHAKGSRFEKLAANLGLGTQSAADIFSDLLREVIQALESIAAFFIDAALDDVG